MSSTRTLNSAYGNSFIGQFYKWAFLFGVYGVLAIDEYHKKSLQKAGGGNEKETISPR